MNEPGGIMKKRPMLFALIVMLALAACAKAPALPEATAR